MQNNRYESLRYTHKIHHNIYMVKAFPVIELLFDPILLVENTQEVPAPVGKRQLS